MREIYRLAIATGIAALFAPGSATADGDPFNGRRVVCFGCHTATSDRTLIGPSLQGIVGRRAATRPGYSYSAALKEAGEKGLVWTEADLANYIKAPFDKVPGTKCFHHPVTDDQKIADIIAYLKSDPKP
jgi:cytochrome c